MFYFLPAGVVVVAVVVVVVLAAVVVEVVPKKIKVGVPNYH